jgi:hypothetical protein
VITLSGANNIKQISRNAYKHVSKVLRREKEKLKHLQIFHLPLIFPQTSSYFKNAYIDVGSVIFPAFFGFKLSSLFQEIAAFAFRFL